MDQHFSKLDYGPVYRCRIVVLIPTWKNTFAIFVSQASFSAPSPPLQNSLHRACIKQVYEILVTKGKGAQTYSTKNRKFSQPFVDKTCLYKRRSLSQILAISNFPCLLAPWTFQATLGIKNVRYLELRYLKLQLT